MFETLDKLTLAGIGALSMTRERAEKLFDEYVNRGQTERARKEGFIKEVMDSADRTRSELEKLVAKQVHETALRLDLPTRDDLARLEAKLDEIIAQQEKHQQQHSDQ
jgi:poly(hydroxyalkanoate) granule-associated protein